jgi:hypothetical protein
VGDFRVVLSPLLVAPNFVCFVVFFLEFSFGAWMIVLVDWNELLFANFLVGF